MNAVAESEIEVEDDQNEDTGKYTFSELSEKAKDKARDAARYQDVGGGSDWWDAVYENAISAGALLGITIGTKSHRTMNDKTVEYPAIYFNGFCSQGDGASFEGKYDFKPGAVDAVKAERPADADLLAIAEELTVAQMSSQLIDGGSHLSAGITTNGSNYSRWNTMQVNVIWESFDEGELYEDCIDEYDLTLIFRRFADWIYKQLEAEHDYLTSDAYIDERLADEEFDADGDII